jgi:hypothetical protein
MPRQGVEPIILQELLPPRMTRGRRVQLEDHDLPESGVVEARELQIERQTYPGGDFVDVQIMALQDEELKLSGWLRDQWATKGFAAAARAQLYQLQAARNPIWLSWGDIWARLMILKRVEIVHELGGMKYSIVLEHLELADDQVSTPLVQDPQQGIRTIDATDARAVELAAIPLPVSL